jgi:hypothetical protein
VEMVPAPVPDLCRLSFELLMALTWTCHKCRFPLRPPSAISLRGCHVGAPGTELQHIIALQQRSHHTVQVELVWGRRLKRGTGGVIKEKGKNHTALQETAS